MSFDVRLDRLRTLYTTTRDRVVQQSSILADRLSSSRFVVENGQLVEKPLSRAGQFWNFLGRPYSTDQEGNKESLAFYTNQLESQKYSHGTTPPDIKARLEAHKQCSCALPPRILRSMASHRKTISTQNSALLDVFCLSSAFSTFYDQSSSEFKRAYPTRKQFETAFKKFIVKLSEFKEPRLSISSAHDDNAGLNLLLVRFVKVKFFSPTISRLVKNVSTQFPQVSFLGGNALGHDFDAELNRELSARYGNDYHHLDLLEAETIIELCAKRLWARDLSMDFIYGYQADKKNAAATFFGGTSKQRCDPLKDLLENTPWEGEVIFGPHFHLEKNSLKYPPLPAYEYQALQKRLEDRFKKEQNRYLRHLFSAEDVVAIAQDELSFYFEWRTNSLQQQLPNLMEIARNQADLGENKSLPYSDIVRKQIVVFAFPSKSENQVLTKKSYFWEKIFEGRDVFYEKFDASHPSSRDKPLSSRFREPTALTQHEAIICQELKQMFAVIHALETSIAISSKASISKLKIDQLQQYLATLDSIVNNEKRERRWNQCPAVQALRADLQKQIDDHQTVAAGGHLSPPKFAEQNTVSPPLNYSTPFLSPENKELISHFPRLQECRFRDGTEIWRSRSATELTDHLAAALEHEGVPFGEADRQNFVSALRTMAGETTTLITERKAALECVQVNLASFWTKICLAPIMIDSENPPPITLAFLEDLQAMHAEATKLIEQIPTNVKNPRFYPFFLNLAQAGEFQDGHTTHQQGDVNPLREGIKHLQAYLSEQGIKLTDEYLIPLVHAPEIYRERSKEIPKERHASMLIFSRNVLGTIHQKITAQKDRSENPQNPVAIALLTDIEIIIAKADEQIQAYAKKGASSPRQNSISKEQSNSESDELTKTYRERRTTASTHSALPYFPTLVEESRKRETNFKPSITRNKTETSTDFDKSIDEVTTARDALTFLIKLLQNEGVTLREYDIDVLVMAPREAHGQTTLPLSRQHQSIQTAKSSLQSVRNKVERMILRTEKETPYASALLRDLDILIQVANESLEKTKERQKTNAEFLPYFPNLAVYQFSESQRLRTAKYTADPIKKAIKSLKREGVELTPADQKYLYSELALLKAPRSEILSLSTLRVQEARHRLRLIAYSIEKQIFFRNAPITRAFLKDLHRLAGKRVMFAK